MARIGLLGGSFNPAHRGHRRISLEAMRVLGLDEVWWLVSPGNPLKEGAKDMAPFEARMASAERMARRTRIRVSDFEKKAGTRFSLDTVRRLRARYPDNRFIWLMGADTLPYFHKWRDWRKLAQDVPIAVIARPGYDRNAHAARAMSWLRRFVRPSGQANDWTEWSAPAILFLRLPPIRPPQPPFARKTPIGMADRARTGTGRGVMACHSMPGDHLTERPAETVGAADRTPIDVEDLHRLVLQSLDDDQAQEVVSIPLAGKSNIADHMVIASGRSTRQVASMAVKLGDRIKQQFGRHVRIEGLPAADWVLIDADDVIVHIFRPEVRNFYNLERMWAFGDDSVGASASG